MLLNGEYYSMILRKKSDEAIIPIKNNKKGKMGALLHENGGRLLWNTGLPNWRS